ncbi:MAG TPA: T9SS type A sorting domain-containing protein [Saprospiraceae bacterium]|nr:T9SS type A sorting domain-containing protein [Saprospiraceae bacterium]HMP24459.1 T9SS type A sorting domain-containing protein [Saprospiraceae bacterium]
MRKIRLLFVFFLAAFTWIMFNSNSGGAGVAQGADRTGSPLSIGTCNACHGGGNFNPSMTAELLKDGMPVTMYEPGEDYTFRLTVTAASGMPSGYGFQAVALRGATNEEAGAWDSSPPGFRITTLSGRRYVEQNSTRNDNRLEIKWTAPQSGSGPVRFYASGNAVNRNGSTGGDSPTSLGMPLTVAEQMTTALNSNRILPVAMTAYPNPARTEVHLQIGVATGGIYWLSLHDLQGRTVQQVRIGLSNGDNLETLDLSGLTAGQYVARLSDGQRIATVPIVKN